MRKTQLWRGLLAITSAGIAVVTVSCGDSALLGHSLPAWLPWREAWVYGWALVVLAASVGLCFGRTAAVSALMIIAYYAVWAVTCVPTIASAPLSIGAWYGFCEAVSSLVGPWILYIALRRRSPESEFPGVGLHAVRLARVLFGLTCIFYGWSHFAYAQYTAGMVPGWLPDRLGWAYFTGFAHIAAGVGIALGVLPRLASLLEAIMMTLFGLLVWVPSFFMQPRPAWAALPQVQWSELVLTLVLAVSGWVVYGTTAPRLPRATQPESPP